MTDKIIFYASKSIEFLFYALFFLVPLFFLGNTSELFEFNKMWLTFGIAVLIGFSWGIKMIASKSIKISRTPLDIPILLFLLAHIISTVFSMDSHVSFWGYYSRFNGGLLSIFTYIFLYYALASNVLDMHAPKKFVRNVIVASLSSAFIVVLWGIPSHFGYDPTCLVFRGSLDVACWTSDFQPKVRIFSTLGQPAWLSAYLVLLIPIALAFAFSLKKTGNVRENILPILLVGLTALMYLAFLYTRTRSGVFGLIVAFAFLAGSLIYIQRKNIIKSLNPKNYLLGIIIVVFMGLSFFIEIPLSPFDKFSYSYIVNSTSKEAETQMQDIPHTSQLGGTDSGIIRLIVWRGALDAWRQNPIFGTGVETFAFAYYKNRPTEHNLTSEWNFLYNKAHNEYLNYLTTTGIFGLGSYMLMIIAFLFIFAFYFFGIKHKKLVVLLEKAGLFHEKEAYKNARDPLLLGVIAGYLTILVTNFFGFSVVIMNIYLILLPLFAFIMLGIIPGKNLEFSMRNSREIDPYQWVGISLLLIITVFVLIILYRFWKADTFYALGNNFNKVQEYQQAHPLLKEAVSLREEPVFLDELAVNNSYLATALSLQEQPSTQSAQAVQNLISETRAISDRLVSNHPNNIIYWKSRVRIFYILAQADPSYLPLALEAMKKTYELGKNEASISYNMGVLYGQNDQPEEAVRELERTIRLKPDYRDAHFALGIFYNELAINERGEVVRMEFREKAISQMRNILENIAPDDQQVKDSLEAWGVSMAQ